MANPDKRPQTTCIHVHTDQVGPEAELTPLLIPEELQRYRRFKVADKAAEFLAGRALLRQELGHRLGIEPQHVRLTTTGNDKPVLYRHTRWHFNLSHSDQHLLLSISDHPIGCDIQKNETRTDIQSLAKHWFHPLEHAQMTSTNDSAEQRLRFFRGWAGKEAVLKASGVGIMGGLKNFAVDLCATESHDIHWDVEPQLDGYVVTPLQAPAGFSAALCSRACEIIYTSR